MATASPEHRPSWLKQPFIVVGVDGSHGSQEALRWAVGEAGQRGASVEAVLVWTDPWAIDGPPSLAGLGKEHLAELHERLSRAVKSATEGADLPEVPVTERVIAGHPAEVLAQESADAVLLVVGTRGLGAVRGLIVGSVSHRCLQLARVPVLVVPDTDLRDRHPAT